LVRKLRLVSVLETVLVGTGATERTRVTDGTGAGASWASANAAGSNRE
jgi:hypothetical protein